jgi:HEAT repeat protein
VTEILAVAAAGLAALLLALIVSIVVRRAPADRRRAREMAVRPEIEAAIADYVVSDRTEPPPLPDPPFARDLVLAVAIEGLAELRGGERERLIALLEGAGIVAATVSRLESRRKGVRREAAEALGYVASAEAASALLAHLDDPDPAMQIACAAALAQLGDAQLAEQILAVAGEVAEARPGPVAAILVTLGRTSPSALAYALAPTAPPELRRLAAAVAGGLRLAEHSDRLRAALASDDDELVARAARGLGMIGEVDAFDALLALLEDPGRAWFVRVAATNALGALGDPRAAPALRRELEGEDWLAQSRAADALGLLGGAGEAELREALASPVESTGDHARVALSR